MKMLFYLPYVKVISKSLVTMPMEDYIFGQHHYDFELQSKTGNLNQIVNGIYQQTLEDGGLLIEDLL